MKNQKKYKIIILVVISLNTLIVCVNVALFFWKSEKNEEVDSLKGLFLTSEIQEKNIEQVQQLARVNHPAFFDVTSYSGYLTVNETTNSHMFFWYFPAVKKTSTTPLILWLNGGPGWSSLYGLFVEIGPFHAISPKELELRKHSWNNQFNLIFIDNPVGTGFSKTDNGYATNEEEVGKDLYTAMKQFFKLFPDLRNNDFYISGESYAGKYIPALANTIHINNEHDKQVINLKGLLIGNGFSDPINQLNYADYLYQQGFIDLTEANILRDKQNECIELITKNNFTEAFKVFSDIILEDSELTPYGTLFSNFTGFSNIYNYLTPQNNDLTELYFKQFLNQNDIQRALHVDDVEYNVKSLKVGKALRSDVMQSMSTSIDNLLKYYRILLYAGQLDVIVAYPNVHNFIINMNFSDNDNFMKAPREKWFVGSNLAGYCRSSGNLTEVMIRNAGHLVPKDQPMWTLDMIGRFINNNKFNLKM